MSRVQAVFAEARGFFDSAGESIGVFLRASGKSRTIDTTLLNGKA
jgi:hypothetical protein